MLHLLSTRGNLKHNLLSDLKMKIIKWTGQVQDHLKWKGIVEKDKTLPEL
jgi:hypothetical protein